MQKQEDIYYQLHNRIMTGEWMPGSRLPTEPKLASDLHIARETLRSVLQRLEKEGLINRYPRLGTFVRQPENRSVKRILLIMSDALGHPFFSPIWVVLPGVMEYCHSLNMECDRLDIHMVDENLPIAENYCGIILSDAAYDGLEDKIEILKKTKVPMVICSGFEASVKKFRTAAVITDRKQAYWDGLEHLLRRGHRKICFLLNENWEDFYLRIGITQREFKQYLSSHGINTQENNFIFLHEWKQRSLSGNDLEQIRIILTGPDRPTVFYCYTDYMAFQVKQILDTMKLRIPEDISLMGFSGFLHGSLGNQYLSTVDFRYDRVVKLTVDLVLAYDHWKGQNPPPVFYAPYDVMPRKSTDKCLIFDWS